MKKAIVSLLLCACSSSGFRTTSSRDAGADAVAGDASDNAGGRAASSSSSGGAGGTTRTSTSSSGGAGGTTRTSTSSSGGAGGTTRTSTSSGGVRVVDAGDELDAKSDGARAADAGDGGDGGPPAVPVACNPQDLSQCARLACTSGPPCCLLGAVCGCTYFGTECVEIRVKP